MLPMETEGAGGCESYPSNYITNKYIYDAFLMIYLFISLLLFFHLVKGTSKELIRDLQRL